MSALLHRIASHLSRAGHDRHLWRLFIPFIMHFSGFLLPLATNRACSTAYAFPFTAGFCYLHLVGSSRRALSHCAHCGLFFSVIRNIKRKRGIRVGCHGTGVCHVHTITSMRFKARRTYIDGDSKIE
ncbi:hypothetical protein B0T14DRAFT_253407 [Immersiella caudata]|uniref:Uncharacterized protein n=1 Tax=Immersiella caudata TaxID=314043 RepID=A0AA39WK10_9PEZI|nr:hypothetical protein B0T14DRAFT_253407 [Immersiella caudata]